MSVCVSGCRDVRPHLLCGAVNSPLVPPLRCVVLGAPLFGWGCWWVGGRSVTSVRPHCGHRNHPKTTSYFGYLISKGRKLKARYLIDSAMVNWSFAGSKSTKSELKRSVNRVAPAVHLEHSFLNYTNNTMQTGDKTFKQHFSN